MSDTKATDEFMNQGFLLYLDSVVTLSEFREVIQTKCAQALTSFMPQLAKAMGVPLNSKQIIYEAVPCIHEKSRSWTNDCIWLHVRIDVGANNPDFHNLSVGLEWDRVNGAVEVTPYTSYCSKSKEAVSRWAKQLACSNIDADPEDYHLTIYGDSVTSDEAFPIKN